MESMWLHSGHTTLDPGFSNTGSTIESALNVCFVRRFDHVLHVLWRPRFPFRAAMPNLRRCSAAGRPCVVGCDGAAGDDAAVVDGAAPGAGALAGNRPRSTA